VEEEMSDMSIEGRTNSAHGIQNECHGSSKETQKVNRCINDTWVLRDYVKAMRDNGNLTAETLAEFFWFAAETTERIWNEFWDVDIDMIDWELLATVYREA